MTQEEFGLIVKAIRTYYPREKILPSQEALTLWYEQLQDLDYRTVVTGLKKWVATNKWSPSIADLREVAAEISKEKVKDWSEAWEDARKAVRRFGSYNPQDAMDSLDELTRETVKRLGYYDLCRSENHDADRANFRNIYEQLAQRKKQEQQIPPAILMAIEGIKRKMIEIAEKKKEDT